MTRVTRAVWILGVLVSAPAFAAEPVPSTSLTATGTGAVAVANPEVVPPPATPGAPGEEVAPPATPADRMPVLGAAPAPLSPEDLKRIEEEIKRLDPQLRALLLQGTAFAASSPAVPEARTTEGETPPPVRPRPAPRPAPRRPAPAHAAAAESDEVVVSAARPASSVDALPVAATVIPAAEFPQVPAANVNDAVVGAGVAEAQGYPAAAFAQANVRGYGMHGGGLDDSQVAVLLDGRPAGTANLAKLPLDGLDRVEAVPGGASALFGTSAMGGAINLVPARGHGSPGGSVEAAAGDGALRRVGGRYGGESGPVDFSVAGGRLTSGDYLVPGSATAVNASLEQWTASFNLGVTPLAGQRLGVSGQGFFGDRMHNPGQLYPGDYPYATFPEDASNFYRKRFSTGEARLTGGGGPLGWTQVVYASQDRDIFHTVSFGTTDDYTTQTDQTGGQHLVNLDVPGWGSATGGVEWFRRASQSADFDTAPFLPRSDTRNLAGLAEVRVAPAFSRLSLQGGVRQDRFTQSVGQPSEGNGIPGLVNADRSWNATTARGGAVITAGAWRAHTALSTGFRAPAAYELAANYVSRYEDGFGDTFVSNYAGNPALKPERSTTSEAGLGWQRGGANADLTYFATELTDRVQTASTKLDAFTTDYTWTNVDGVGLAGLEGSLELPLPAAAGLTVVATAHGTYHLVMRVNDPAEVERTGSSVPLNVARWFGSAGLRVGKGEGAAGGWTGRLSVQARGLEHQQDFNAYAPVVAPYDVFPTLPPYGVWTLDARYWVSPEVQAFATVANVTNEAYENIRFYPMPGTTATGGVRVSF